MAIEDAVVLAARLTGASTLEAGLADYVQARQARTAKMIKTASANREAKTAGPIGRRVREVVMPIVLRHFYERATGWLYTDPGFTSDRVRPAADAPPGPGRR
jgi:2-polyprenyl-6-methoxyphenol hydroxylase-like FAD-dependent oxidoreductase